MLKLIMASWSHMVTKHMQKHYQVDEQFGSGVDLDVVCFHSHIPAWLRLYRTHLYFNSNVHEIIAKQKIIAPSLLAQFIARAFSQSCIAQLVFHTACFWYRCESFSRRDMIIWANHGIWNVSQAVIAYALRSGKRCKYENALHLKTLFCLPRMAWYCM